MKEQKGQSDDATATQLASAAKALREFGADVLRGDFGSFDQMEQRVRAVARDIEGITIWSSDRGDSGMLAETIAKIRSGYPNVPIATRTYQRPTPPVAAGTPHAPAPPRTFRNRIRSLLRLIAGEVD